MGDTLFYFNGSDVGVLGHTDDDEFYVYEPLDI